MRLSLFCRVRFKCFSLMSCYYSVFFHKEETHIQNRGEIVGAVLSSFFFKSLWYFGFHRFINIALTLKTADLFPLMSINMSPLESIHFLRHKMLTQVFLIPSRLACFITRFLIFEQLYLVGNERWRI